MIQVVVTGGGICGLITAMLLARDRHEVTVLERDDMGAPSTPEAAWASWERKGVNQFRLLHYFLARFRAIVSTELPELMEAFDAAGTLRFNPISAIPEFITGGFREGDERFECITGRRPVMEAAVAAVAERTPGISIRRGAAVQGLLAGASARNGIPHAAGVRLESGEEIAADLIVDATGRRSPLPRWIDGIGARPPHEELDDCGFIYYGRHFRSHDGSIPPPLGGLLQHFGSISVLTLPGDHGTWGVGVITSAADTAMRALKDPDRWTAVMKEHPMVAHWIDGEPLGDFAVMAKIEDRYRRYVVDGEPVVTGVVPVADSWACTNPSVGRGISLGTWHATVLRDTVRAGYDDPREFVLAYDAATVETVEPWYRSTLWFDRHRLAAIDAAIEGRPYEPDDKIWDLFGTTEAVAANDPDILRGFLEMAMVLASPEDVFSRPGFTDRVGELAKGGVAPVPAPSRERLLELVS